MDENSVVLYEYHAVMWSLGWSGGGGFHRWWQIGATSIVIDCDRRVIW